MISILSLRTAANLVLLAVLFPVMILVSRRVMGRKLSFVWLYAAFGLAAAGYFVPGDLMGWDAPNHAARTWIFADAMRHLDIPPVWTYRWYLGFPLSLYYGPVYYLMTGLMTLGLGGNVFLATKVSLWSLHVVSGLTMFALARELTRSSAAAFFAATFYVMSFQHLAIIMQAGALPLSIIFPVLPVALLVLERLLRSQLSRVAVLTAFPLAVLLSVMLLSHAQYGLFGIATFMVVALCRLAASRETRSRHAMRSMCLAAGFVALFCAWFLGPLLWESRHVMLGRDPISLALGHIARLSSGKAWLEVSGLAVRSSVSSTMTIFYFGLVPLLVALGAWLSRSKARTDPRPTYLLAWTGALLYSVINTRFIVFCFMLTSVLSAFGVAALEATMLRRRPRSWSVIYSALLVAAVLDLGLMLVPPRFETFKDPAPEGVRKLLRVSDAPIRMLTVYPTEVTLWSHVVVIDSGLATPLGGIPQEAPSSYPYIAAVASKATIELLDTGMLLTRSTIDALRVLNVRFVWAPRTNVLVEVALPSPVWFSSRRMGAEWVTDSRLDKRTWQALRDGFKNRDLDYATPLRLVKEMELDSYRPIAGRIPMGGTDREEDIVPDGAQRVIECRVIEHRESHSRVRIRYFCSEPAHALLAYSFFPDVSVRIDDAVERRAYRSAMNLTALEVPAGDHTIVLEAHVSHARRGLAGLSAAGIALAGLWYATVRRRQLGGDMRECT